MAQVAAGLLDPRAWFRSVHYLVHRVRRLPGSPEWIANGIGAGVFTCFTPFVGAHILVSWAVAKIVGGSVLAALVATCLFNPLTFVPVAALSIAVGNAVRGREAEVGADLGIVRVFLNAWRGLRDNVAALFSDRDADWGALAPFWHDVFVPYLVGGALIGTVAGVVAFFVSLPVLRAYQARRVAKNGKPSSDSGDAG